MSDDDDNYEDDPEQDQIEKALHSFDSTANGINLDARRKLEYLQDLKALRIELGEDYYDNLIDQIW